MTRSEPKSIRLGPPHVPAALKTPLPTLFMTGYTVHTGTNQKFASGWSRIFAKKKKSTSKAEEKAASAEKKSNKK